MTGATRYVSVFDSMVLVIGADEGPNTIRTRKRVARRLMKRRGPGDRAGNLRVARSARLRRPLRSVVPENGTDQNRKRPCHTLPRYRCSVSGLAGFTFPGRQGHVNHTSAGRVVRFDLCEEVEWLDGYLGPLPMRVEFFFGVAWRLIRDPGMKPSSFMALSNKTGRVADSFG